MYTIAAKPSCISVNLPCFTLASAVLKLPYAACVCCVLTHLLLLQVCQLPTILAHPWFERLVAGSQERLVSKAAFVEWWISRQLVAAPATRRLWEVLRPDGKQYLTYADFRPLLQAVLQYHPGLEFLADTPEFQARYAETVIYRIFYTINRWAARRGWCRACSSSCCKQSWESAGALKRNGSCMASLNADNKYQQMDIWLQCS